jgi:mRNA-degrading endonuclease toxin of MazEF toxin-antitoxin module
VTVASITSTIRGTPSEVVLTPDDGFPNDCAVNLYNIYTVPQANMGPFIAHLSLDKMRAVRAAIEFALGFDALD